MQFVQTHLFSD